MYFNMQVIAYLVVMVTAVSSQTIAISTCASRKVVEIGANGANVLIGGFFPLRTQGYGNYGCGPVGDAPYNIQAFEAARFAIARVNSAVNYFPGVRLGMRAYDTCSSSSVAAQAASGFLPHLSSTPTQCTTDTARLIPGIVGGHFSHVTKSVASMLQSFDVAQVAYSSRSSEFSDVFHYPNLLRTDAPPKAIAEVITVLLETLQWDHIGIVFTDDVFGRSLRDLVLRHTYNRGICAAHVIAMPTRNVAINDLADKLRPLLQSDVTGIVFAGQNMNVPEFFQALNQSNPSRANSLQFVFPWTKFSKPFASELFRGSLSLTSKSKFISEFADYFSTLDPLNPSTHTHNPWFQEWYMASYQCRLQTSTNPRFQGLSPCVVPNQAQRRASFRQDESVEQVIKAVYVLANALRRARSFKCQGSPQSFCSQFTQMPASEFLNYVKGTSFTFSAQENIPSMVGTTVRFDGNQNLDSYDGFDIYNFNNRAGTGFQFQNVGSFTRQSGLSLNTPAVTMYGSDRITPLGSIPLSDCATNNCSYCILPPSGINYYTTSVNSGLLIGGLFPVHTSDPLGYTCKDVDIQGSMYSLAYYYALEQAQQKYPGLSLGGLFIDSCNRAENIASNTNSFLNNHLPAMDQNGNRIHPARVVGYIDGSHAKSAVPVATMLNSLEVPDIGTMATGNHLYDAENFPFYTSTVPPNSEQARAMVQFLILTGFSYIQTVHRADVYGRQGQMDFKMAADMHSVCIAGSYELGTDGSSVNVMNQIQMNPSAKAIVVFGNTADVEDIFEAILQTGSQGEYVVFANSGWGDNPLHSRLNNVASGSFTIALRATPVAGFETYLRGLNAGATSIPFYSDLYERAFSCSLNSLNMRAYTTVCVSSQTLNNNNNAYSSAMQNTVQFTIRAVEVFAQAVDEVVQEVCSSSIPCQTFYDLPNARERIMEKIKAIRPLPLVPYTYQILNYRPTQSQIFTSVGRYDPTNRVTSLTSAPVLPNNGSIGSLVGYCSGFCQQCSYLIARQPYMMTEGDIMIGALVGLSMKEKNPYLCLTAKSVNGFQYAAAIQYALELINSGASSVKLNGVKLGSLIMDDCDNAERAFSLLGGLYSNTFKPSGFDQDTLRAWLSFSTDSTMESGKFLGPLSIPVVSPLASAVEFHDIQQFPSLYLTVPRLNKVVSAMLQLLRALGFHYVQLLYSPTAYGRSAMEELEAAAKGEGICVVDAYELTSGNNSATIQSLTRGQANVVLVFAEESYYGNMVNQIAASLSNNFTFISSLPMKLTTQNEISVALPEPKIQNFTNFLSKQNGHFFMRYYQEKFKCKLPGAYSIYSTPCPSSVQNAILNSPTDLNVLATIDAVQALGAAIHKTLQQLCGMNYDGICGEFELSKDTNKLILENLGQVSFLDITGKRFAFENREANENLELLQRSGNAYTKVGSFSNGYLSLLNADPQKKLLLQSLLKTPSSCASPCTKCIQKSLNFTFIPGDVYIGGMFDVHTRSISPFTCGRVKTLHGFQLLEAFQFAVHRVNDKLGIFSDKLKGVTLGAIGMDSCESAVRTGYQVSNIHNGRYVVKKNGYEVDPSDIKAYVAAYESDRTKYLARILGSLGLPQVSYGATSIELTDKERYPFFLRTVPADDHQSDAILAFLNDQDLRYVQVLSSPTDYGRLGSQTFMERAGRNRICIAQSVVFSDNGTITRESANDAVTTILDKPLANIIVIFADTGYLNEFLLAMKRNREANGNFRFVGSITWPLNFQVDPSLVASTLGAITLNLESINVNDFDTYLDAKSPSNYRENPWFDEYYEEIQNCYLRNPLDDLFQNRPPCGTDFKSVFSANRYLQDPGVVHVVNAVYATALGLDYALKELCGANYTGVCETFRASPTSELIFNGIEMARFKDDTEQNFEFTNRRDGNKGYTLHSIEKSTNERGYFYNNIGSYRNQSGLTMKSYTPTWNGSCDRPRVCTECPSLRDSVTRYMDVSPGVAPNVARATIIGVFDLHKSRPYDEFLCGEMNYQTTFHNIMAFYYTLEKLVNSRPEFSSKVKINGLALDTCSSSIRVDSDLYGLISGKGLCHSDTDLATKMDLSKIGGVLTMGDDNTFAANRVLAPLAITMVSPDASSLMFQNTDRYDYLFRATPPSSDQALAILSLLRRMGWNYISVVYTDNGYGSSLHSTLIQYAEQDKTNPVCVGLSQSVSEEASVETHQSVIRRLDEQGQDGARVVVLLTTKDSNSLLISAIKSVRPITKFIFIGTDSWATDPEVLRNQEAFLSGAVTLKRIQPQVQSFKEYFAELSYIGNRKGLPNDWFEEWYQHAHGCYLGDSEVSLGHLYKTVCREDLLLNASLIHHDMTVFHTILSTYAIAKGLRDAAQDCTNATLAECIRNGGYGFRSRIFSATSGLEWNDVGTQLNMNSLQDYKFIFNKMRYGNTGYTMNSVVYGDTGRLEYKEIGNYTSSLMLGDVSFYDDMESKCLLKDRCSCAVFGAGVAALTGTGWEELGDLPRNYYDLETTVYSNGTVLYKRRFDWPIWAIVMGILTALGIFVCVILIVILICCYPVKTGTTILGFMLLVGILLMYAINFAFFLPASAATCGIRRFFMGIVYAVCFAALLVKAADNWRYGEFDTMPKKYKGITSVLGLFLIALFLVFIQVIIPILWLMVDQPAAYLISSGVIPHDFWWCGPPLFYDFALVLSFIYVGLLVLLTIIFGVLAWYNTNNYYESRWILGVSISTAGILMVWMLVSTMGAVPYRDAAVAVGNWVNATILLICLPLRKTYLLFQILRYGSEDDMSEKEDINGYSTEFVNTTFDADDYGYNTKSGYSMNGKAAMYSTQGGQVVLQRAPEVHTQQTQSVAMQEITAARETGEYTQSVAMQEIMAARETGEQTATMEIGPDDVAAVGIVVESSGSAAVAAEAPPMEGEGLAVAKLHGDISETRIHTEVQHHYKQEEYVTYNNEYEYGGSDDDAEIAIEPPSEEMVDPVIITEPMSSGSDSDSDSSDFDMFERSEDAFDVSEGEATMSGHQKKVFSRSYEVTREEETIVTTEG